MTKKIALSVLCLLLTVLALFSGWKIYSEISARQREKDEFSVNLLSAIFLRFFAKNA